MNHEGFSPIPSTQISVPAPKARKRKPRQPTSGTRRHLNKDGSNSSLWSVQENIAYMGFLVKQGHLYNTTREGLKVLKINVRMSHAVRTRTADQCRSHHQKMMKYHGSIANIVSYIRQLSKDYLSCTKNEDELMEQTPSIEVMDLPEPPKLEESTAPASKECSLRLIEEEDFEAASLGWMGLDMFQPDVWNEPFDFFLM